MVETERVFNAIEKLTNTINDLGKTNIIEYIQIFFSIISVIVAAWAVVVARKIPNEIASKQNDIALFEKRYEAYDVLQRYINCAELLKNTKNNDYKSLIVTVFLDGDDAKYQNRTILIILERLSVPLQHCTFLFDNIKKAEAEKMMLLLGSFVSAFSYNDKNTEFYKQQYIKLVDEFKDKHYQNILNSLKLL